ncbi:MAG: hypothetical protein HYX89_02070 [Chloroflexi bacterium]|nr:hypothetical protein [Chloroflexota bacterium]
MGTMRLIYFYGVAFIALQAVAFGASHLLSTLVEIVFGPAMPIVGGAESYTLQISSFLALLIVATPVWAIHWWAAQRSAAQREEERQSIFRRLFLSAVLGVAAVVTLFQVAHVIRPFLAGWARPILSEAGESAAWFIVYGLIWYYYRRVDLEDGRVTPGSETVRRWYIYIVSAVSLATFGYNIVQLLQGIVGDLMALLAPLVALGGTYLTLTRFTEFFPHALVAGLWWVFYWRMLAGTDQRSVLRQIYLYLALFVGVVGTLASLGFIGFELLRFALGYRAVAVIEQWVFLVYALPILLVAAASWVYHASVLNEEGAAVPAQAASVRRIYTYLLSAIGLGGVILGAANLVRIVLEFAVQTPHPEFIAGEPWWRDQLSGFSVVLVIGLVVWLIHWLEAQGRTLIAESDERQALSRRIYLYLALFATVIMVLVSFVGLINGLLRALFGEALSRLMISGMLSDASIAAIAGAYIVYHWGVLRGDQAAAEAVPRRRKIVMALVGSNAEPLIAQLEEALGTRIRLLQEVAEPGPPAAPTLSPEELATLVERIRQAPSEKVLLLLRQPHIEVVSYR